MAHGRFSYLGQHLLGVGQQGGFPEAKGAMLLKSSHVTHQALIFEMGKAPFNGFGDSRVGGMYQAP